MKYRINRVGFLFALTTCVFAGQISAQETEPSWIKCERTESTPHSDSDNSSFVLDPISFYYRVNGATVVRMWNDNGAWREDSRCVDYEANSFTWESFGCAVDDNKISLQYSYVTYESTAEEAWRAGEPATVDFRFNLFVNRRDGTFRSTRTEYRNGETTRAAETSTGTCSRVADPRPPAKF